MHRSMPTRRTRLAVAALATFGSGALQAANVNWVGGNASFWDLASNWSTGVLPGAADDVLLGAFNTTLRSGTFNLQSFSGTGTLSLTGGALGNTLASSLGALNMSAGTLGGTGGITIAGASSWSGGSMSGAGSTSFGDLAITGAATKVLVGGRTLNLNGTTTWSGNTAANNNAIRFWNGATINNSGTFNDANAFASFLEHNVGGPHAFNNAGTYNKLSNTVTTVDSGVAFNNTGTVNVNAGTFLPNGGGTSSGIFNIASGAKLELRNGNHTLNNVTTSGAGIFEISTENVGADAFVALNGGTHTTHFVLSGSTLAGSNHALQGLATWSGGTITGTATQATTFGNALTISGANGKTLSGGRTVNAGNTTWSGNTASGNNAIAISGGSAFNSNGTFTDANTFNSTISRGNGGGAFNNNGVFNKQSNTTTSIGTAFNNTNTVNVNAGTLLLSSIDASTSSGAFNIAAGAKLEYRNGNHTLNNVTTSGAGLFEISTENVGADAFVAVNGGTHTTAFVLSGSTMGGSSHTFQGPVTWSGGTISGAGTTTFTNDVAITGANTKVLVGGRTLTLEGTTTWSGNTAANNNAIRFWNGATINNSGTFNDANAFASFLEHNVGGPHAFNNAGTYNKLSNTVTTVDLGVVFNNSGTVNLNAGTMSFVSGTQGPTGTVRVASGATFQHGAASTVGNMVTAGNLALGDRTLTVFNDYDNANFGVGNAFNRRANVSTTGTGNRLLAAGDANQGLTGAGISGGNTATPTIQIGNVHVGANTFTYNIANTGSAGPALRGAIQDAANGGNITDARLSGNGVQAGNWGPVAAGSSLQRDVVVTVGTAGVFAPIAGQAVSIVNNFDNTRSQLLTISSASGAAAYNLAAAAAVTPNPVTLANQRVGGASTAALTITNAAPAGSFTEGLNASFGATTGAAATNSGAVNLLGGGASNATAMRVGLDGSSAGAKSGTVRVNLASDGSGSSLLGTTQLAPQTVAINGAFYNTAVGQASPTPVVIANQRINGNGSQALTVSNTAAAGAYSEALNASFSAVAAGLSASGSLSDLVAGGSNNSALRVGVDTTTAGAKSGNVTLAYQSDGTGANGRSGLAAIGAGTQTLAVSGNVYQTAIGALQTPALNFGTVQVGQSVSQNLVVRNVATGAAGFVEDLNASFGSASGTGAGLISGSGSLSGITAGSSSGAANGTMTVAVNTAAAGIVNGNIAVNYFTAGSINGVGNGLGIAAANSELFGVAGSIQASGNVINQANPLVTTPTINLGAVRVGAAAPSGTVSISNVAGAPPQAALNASIAPADGPVTASGSFNLLNPGATDSSSLRVGLNTTTAGNFTGANAGSATINLVSDASNVGNCAPNCQLNLAPQSVSVQGKVYAPAVGQLDTAALDFGIVRVGDTVAARNVVVTNAAAVTALNDTLRADLSGVGSPFSSSQSVAQIGAQASGSIVVGLATASAGVFNQTGTVSFLSQNPDMADVSAGANGSVQIKAQVNNLANAAFDLNAGIGVLKQFGDQYVLDLGNIVIGTLISELLSLENRVVGPADDLRGLFNTQAADDFAYIGWDPFTGLTAGQAITGLQVGFTATKLGRVDDLIAFDGWGYNASDPAGLAQSRSLLIRANVISAGEVPEPGTTVLVSIACLAMWAARRRQARQTRR
jgi:hypothetical protein